MYYPVLDSAAYQSLSNSSLLLNDGLEVTNLHYSSFV